MLLGGIVVLLLLIMLARPLQMNFLGALLIVLFSSLLPNEQLRGFHIGGALLGFVGASLLISKGQRLTIDPQYSVGYLAALACAFIWSIYSVLSRRFGAVR